MENVCCRYFFLRFPKVKHSKHRINNDFIIFNILQLKIFAVLRMSKHMCILSQYNLKIIVYVYKKQNLIQAFEIFESGTL